MGIQVVVKTPEARSIESAFGAISAQIEIFPLGNGHFGVSIPMKVVDVAGEELIFGKLAALEHYELWSGDWKIPN
jgi:hypothetical protein